MHWVSVEEQKPSHKARGTPRSKRDKKPPRFRLAGAHVTFAIETNPIYIILTIEILELETTSNARAPTEP